MDRCSDVDVRGVSCRSRLLMAEGLSSPWHRVKKQDINGSRITKEQLSLHTGHLLTFPLSSCPPTKPPFSNMCSVSHDDPPRCHVTFWPTEKTFCTSGHEKGGKWERHWNPYRVCGILCKFMGEWSDRVYEVPCFCLTLLGRGGWGDTQAVASVT